MMQLLSSGDTCNHISYLEVIIHISYYSDNHIIANDNNQLTKTEKFQGISFERSKSKSLINSYLYAIAYK